MGGLEYLGATDSIREMKLCSSLLLSVATAQFASYAGDTATDRWGSYDYAGGFTYPTGSKTDGGASTTDDFNQIKHENGLWCWNCKERLDLGKEEETTKAHAYTRCLLNGSMEKGKGEQRTCMFEERRRKGVVYSVCTGCKQTDACLALWRRNQRFTLPFMNFGDRSLDQHADGKPIYVDDECTAYANLKDSSQAVDARAGLSYAKFSYDTNTSDQANGQMSQWESSCRWCCAARSDAACNIYAENSSLNDNPFATQCGTSTGSGAGASLDSVFTSAPTSLTGSSFNSVTCQLSNTSFGNGAYNGDARFFLPFMLADPKGAAGNFGTASMFIDDFVKTAMLDLGGASSGNPVTGEGRNSVGMDKYRYRGNSYSAQAGEFPDHVFEHQSDMPSQENRDFFDARIAN